MPDGRRVEPSQVVRDYARDLNDLRQRFKDDPAMARQIAEVERALTQATVGDISGPVLQERLSRTVLPQLETLEVQMRQKVGEESGGQVRSAGTERMPDGFGTRSRNTSASSARTRRGREQGGMKFRRASMWV